MEKQPVLGIIGGSGLYAFQGLEDVNHWTWIRLWKTQCTNRIGVP